VSPTSGLMAQTAPCRVSFAMDKNVGVYKITSPSGRVYIGQSVNLAKRFKQYKRLDCKFQSKLYNSLLKYGVDAHKFEIIAECMPNELNALEAYYVDFYQSFNTEHGMNLKQGGSAQGEHSDETKRKISIGNKGKKRSDAAKKWNRERQLGNKSHVYGKKQSIQHRQKLSMSLKGHKVSDETRLKLSVARSKPINQFSLDGVLIKTHESTLSAAKELNANPIAIGRCVNGRSKTSWGFKWEKVNKNTDEQVH
jgi:group I intron endonuclease